MIYVLKCLIVNPACHHVGLHFVCFSFLDTLSPTTPSAPRSLCMRRTAPWLPDSSGCAKSLTRWGCAGLWRVFSSSTSTGCPTCYFCSWGQRFSNCEWLLFRGRRGFSCTVAWGFVSLLQAWWRAECRRRWSWGAETPDDWGSCVTEQSELPVSEPSVALFNFSLVVRFLDDKTGWSRTGWLTTASATGGAPTLSLRRSVHIVD